MKSIDKSLNSITMYRLVVYGLFILSVIAMALGLFGLISPKPLDILLSLAILFVACVFSNYVFAKIWKATVNSESAYITALILSFLLMPSHNVYNLLIVALAGVIAMASKYVFAIQRKHIFNPAGVSALILGLFGSGLVVWWVGTPYLALPVLILGLLILRKLHRFHMFGSFAITSFVILLIMNFVSLGQSVMFAKEVFLSWPLLFFGMVMLTEPLTTPPTHRLQIIYGVIVGFLFGVQFHFGPIFSTPELALICGNIFSYIVSPKGKIRLTFDSKRQLTPTIYDWSFIPDRKFTFTPGQYMEWTLSHPHADLRGERRYFTIASSPTESFVHLGSRIDAAKGRSFKKKLFNMQKGETIMTANIEGDFVMPQDKTVKLIWIAGGIGITPFRSQMKYLFDKGEKRDIILMYASAVSTDFAYKEEIEMWKEKIGMRVVYIVTNPETGWIGRTGFITEQVIKEEISDFSSRDFYLSGPEAMVRNYEKLLLGMNVEGKDIHIDDFPGY